MEIYTTLFKPRRDTQKHLLISARDSSTCACSSLKKRERKKNLPFLPSVPFWVSFVKTVKAVIRRILNKSRAFCFVGFLRDGIQTFLGRFNGREFKTSTVWMRCSAVWDWTIKFYVVRELLKIFVRFSRGTRWCLDGTNEALKDKWYVRKKLNDLIELRKKFKNVSNLCIIEF